MCEAGWHYIRFIHSRIYLNNVEMHQLAAAKTCQRMGAGLIEIKSEDILNEVATYLNYTGNLQIAPRKDKGQDSQPPDDCLIHMVIVFLPFCIISFSIFSLVLGFSLRLYYISLEKINGGCRWMNNGVPLAFEN